jgi:predicted transcriptional regulator
MPATAVIDSELDTAINVKMPSELVREVRQLAVANDRAMSAEVRRAIRQHCERERQEAAA